MIKIAKYNQKEQIKQKYRRREEYKERCKRERKLIAFISFPVEFLIRNFKSGLKSNSCRTLII